MEEERLGVRPDEKVEDVAVEDVVGGEEEEEELCALLCRIVLLVRIDKTDGRVGRCGLS